MTGYTKEFFGLYALEVGVVDDVVRPMNPVVGRMWVDALRSGDYERGEGRLVTQLPCGRRRFCCLGVLCDLAARAGLVVYGGSHADFRGVDDASAERPWFVESATLPEVVARWAGLFTDDPYVRDERTDDKIQLSQLNDFYHADFTVIADAIERSLLAEPS